jgi:hypothetical protein
MFYRGREEQLMDWDKAIAINHSALARIVAALVALLELAGSSAAARLPEPLYRAVWRVLGPAESAVRRLIVMAARGLVVKLSPSRLMPRGLAIAATGNGRVSFQLFDTRKHFAPWRPTGALAKAGPRIHVFDASPLVPLFLRSRPAESRPVERKVAAPDGTVSALRLNRRLAAVKLALDDLPRQARRLARWKIRRERIQRPVFRTPLRPGPPPGHRKKPRDEIDFVLKECHALARDALKEDTS